MRPFLLLLLLSGCGGLVVTTNMAPPPRSGFFARFASHQLKEAYADLCPSVRETIDYRAFVIAALNNPFLRYNGGFSSGGTSFILGSKVYELAGYLATLSGSMPTTITFGEVDGKACILGAVVASSPILPPFGVPGPAAPAESEYLPGDQIKAAISGRTFDGIAPGGTRFVIEMRSDGTRSIEATVLGTNKAADTGEWHVSGNKLCAKWSQMNGGRETCVRYVQLSDGTLEAYDEEGFLQSRLRARP
jgi:hypothetical protein